MGMIMFDDFFIRALFAGIGLAVVVMAFATFLPSMKNSVEGAAPVSGAAE